jgi:hypothetical protein
MIQHHIESADEIFRDIPGQVQQVLIGVSLEPAISRVIGTGIAGGIDKIVLVVPALLVPVVPGRDVYHIACEYGRKRR